jgi:hypothetical protein
MRTGFAAVVGRPNVGKSMLVNALCGGKVAIVSDKPQTTRRRIVGIANGEDYQLVLSDLPGFQRPRDPLTERMQRTVDQNLDDVDAILSSLARERIRRRPLQQDARPRHGRDRAQQGRPPQARPIAGRWRAAQLGDRTSIHDADRRCIDALRDELVALLPEGPRCCESSARLAPARRSRLIRERSS